MRKVTFGGAISFDNFIARLDGSFDWIMHSDDAGELMKEYWQKIDTIVMGRKTYDIAVQYAPKNKKAKNPYGNIKTFVFSRSLEPATRDGATFVSTDPGKFVGKLKKENGKEICVMGGGDLAKNLFEAGVIDEIGFNVHPVLLGSGIPLFHEMKRQIDLELLECRPFKNGCFYVLYRVKHLR